MTATVNKGYPLQVTGTNIGTWGTIINNGALQVIDNNLGGTLDINVAGSSNINLTAAQASYLIHNLTGALTGNIQYIFPAAGGFYAINNQTSGAYTVTVAVVGGSGTIIVPQGTTGTIYIDATVPSVYGFTGTSAQFAAASVTGTGNAIVIPSTVPVNFSLANAVVYFFPIAENTGPTTLNVAGTGNIAVKKGAPSGYVDLVLGDFIPGFPITVMYDAAIPAWIALTVIYEGTPQLVSTNQALDYDALFNSYIASTALSLTISRTATTLAPYWWIEGNALGGAITIIPDSHDTISVSGSTLSAGTSYVIPRGITFKLSTDANGHLYVLFNSTSLDTIGSTQGDILYRSASAWTVLAPGTSGQFLKTNGASANPAWASVPTATSSVLGLVKPDGTIITITGGAITVAQGSSSAFGVIKVDGTTITASAGIISAATQLMTPLAVGAIINASNDTGGTISAGSTTAAANLTAKQFRNSPSSPSAINVTNSGDSLTGTWKALQTVSSGNYGLFQRTV